MKTYYCVCTSYDDRGLVASNIVDTVETTSRPENSFKSTRRKDIYLDWFDSLSAARSHVEWILLA